MFPTHLESTSPGGGEPFLLVVSWLVVMILFSYLPKCTVLPPTTTHGHAKQKKVNSGGCTFASRLAFLVAQAS